MSLSSSSSVWPTGAVLTVTRRESATAMPARDCRQTRRNARRSCGRRAYACVFSCGACGHTRWVRTRARSVRRRRRRMMRSDLNRRCRLSGEHYSVTRRRCPSRTVGVGPCLQSGAADRSGARCARAAVMRDSKEGGGTSLRKASRIRITAGLDGVLSHQDLMLRQRGVPPLFQFHQQPSAHRS